MVFNYHLSYFCCLKFYTSLNIGEFHTLYCEDFLVNEPIATHQRLIAVIDGCTMGTESVFASILYGKTLRAIAKRKFYHEFVSSVDLDIRQKLKEIFKELIIDLKQIKNQLDLTTHELLATLILGIIDIPTATAEFITIGDGLIYHDGKSIVYDQNDKPDYLGYHLHKDFDLWYDSQQQTLSISRFKNLSICTDGIFSFKNLKNKDDQKSEQEIIEYFLFDVQFREYDNFLERKVKNLKNEMNHIVTDDLAIIRIIR